MPPDSTEFIDYSVHKGVILFKPELVDEDYYDQSAQIALYSDPEGEHLVDSLKWFFHHNEAPGFMFDGAMPLEEDLFSYLVEGKRHYGLIYTSASEPSYEVLRSTLGESRWVDLNELPWYWEAVPWDSIGYHLDLKGQLIQSQGNYVKAYRDSSMRKSDQRITRYNYGVILDVIENKMLVEVYSPHYEKNEWGAYGYEPEKIKDSVWVYLNYEKGESPIRFIPPFPEYGNYNRGTGILVGEFQNWNRFSTHKYVPPSDSIPLYGNSKTEPIGWIPVYGDVPYMYGSYINGKDTTIHLRWTGDYEWYSGLVSLEGMRVFGDKRHYLKLIKDKYLSQEIWIDINDLGDDFEYMNWMRYFKRFPNGNEGWLSGYSWCGNHDFVYSEPNRDSKQILELPAQVEIYLTGEYEGSWAKVHVKEVRHNFGEIYFSGSDYFNEWDGWIEAVQPSGLANLDEIILGC